MPNAHVVLGGGSLGHAAAALTACGIEPAVVTRSGASMSGAVSHRADLAAAPPPSKLSPAHTSSTSARNRPTTVPANCTNFGPFDRYRLSGG